MSGQSEFDKTKFVTDSRLVDTAQFVDSLPIQSMFEGRFKVESLLGAGGSGQVYKCIDTAMNRHVALKILAGRFDSKAIRRFQIEANATSRLDHANLIKIYDFGISQDNVPFIVMEFVEGQSLADLLKSSVRLSVAECTSLLLPVFDALQSMHDQGVIHRDLKPGNIIVANIRGKQTAKIVDFGIAKILSESPDGQPHLTQTGEIFGSPLYMSPEQASGIGVSASTDQYSLGCVIFECLTGTTPHVGKSSIETLLKHQSEATPSLREASMGEAFAPGVERVVEKLLSKNPGARYASMADAEKAFASSKYDNAAPFTKKAIPTIAESKVERRWFSITSLGLGFAVLILIFFALFWVTQKKTEKVEIKPAVIDGSVQSLDADVAERALNSTAFINLLQQYPYATDVRINADESESKATFLNKGGSDGINFGGDIADKGLAGFLAMHQVNKLMILGCRQITDTGMRSVMHLPLVHVQLTGSSIGDATTKALLKKPTVQRLFLKETLITDEAFSEPSTALTTLDISHTKIGAKGFKYLSAFTNLTSLTASDTSMNDADLKKLSRLPITGLLLSRTQLTDQSASTIAGFSKLNYLAVSGTNITGKFLKALAKLNLFKIDITDCPQLTAADVAAFTAEHPHCDLLKPRKNEFSFLVPGALPSTLTPAPKPAVIKAP